MTTNAEQQSLLRKLPGVDRILEQTKCDPFFKDIPVSVVVESIRSAIDQRRQAMREGNQVNVEASLLESQIVAQVKTAVSMAMTPNLRPAVNATGVVVHTNLGRSLLAPEVVENLVMIASRYSNLEYDLSAGRRGSRYSHVEDILCEISGAESAMVVNNNAGAVLLCLETIARDKTVIVSRGELVEIGGSFRIPDVMAKSGATLREVGTTNRTHLKDYIGALENETGLLLKVHRSNYSVVGFTAEVSLRELAKLGTTHRIPVMEDLGSGTFIDFSKYGLMKEPTVQESVATGADVITFSGDKLLGGPQAGIIVGKKNIIDQIKQNPTTRALRIDKLTLAALEGTLRLYRDESQAIRQIPTLRMLTRPVQDIETQAAKLAAQLKSIGDARMQIHLIERSSRAGGGALPLLELPSRCLRIRIQGLSATELERMMRYHTPPIIGRLEENAFIIDLRTVQDDEIPFIARAFEALVQRV
ncbi:MAG: L-seryl-tRNA(Sec) selenium transferase [Desulfobacterales bacterium]|nr:MAG: L-seryl-tRNA(Sec) selenium transferase [Desulfobacterales bacterium]